MHRIFSHIFILACFVFLFSTTVLAVTPCPTTFIAASGANCGNALSTDACVTKCCKSPINSPDLVNQQLRNSMPAIIPRTVTDSIADQINKKANIIDFTQTQVTNQPCIVGVPSTPGDPNSSACICLPQPSVVPTSALLPICNRITTGERSQCESCTGSGGYWSSLGCFNGNQSEFITKNIFGTGVSLAGGISLLCIMFAAFQMQTSSGNAEKIKKAQELLTNCITGLMVIIFSILILKIIGVNILKIPGFS